MAINATFRGVQKCYAEIKSCKEAASRAKITLLQLMPPGTEVKWEISRNGEKYIQRGIIVHHMMRPGDITVQNNATGKTTRISMHGCWGFSAAGVHAPNF